MQNWINFVFIGTVGWGISLSLIKVLLGCLSPLDVVLYRMIVGLLFLILLIKLLDLRVTHFTSLMKDGVVFGIFNVTMPFYLTSYAEKTVSSALSAAINGLTPLCTFILAILFFNGKQHVRYTHFVSLLLGLAGVVLVNQQLHGIPAGEISLIALILSGISYAISANYLRSRTQTNHPLLISAVAAGVTIIMLLCYKCIRGELSQWPMPRGLTQGAALLWLGAVGSGWCFYLYCVLIQNVGAVTASMTTYLMVLTGLFSGVVVLGERVSILSWVGCGCILLSLILTLSIPTKKPHAILKPRNGSWARV